MSVTSVTFSAAAMADDVDNRRLIFQIFGDLDSTPAPSNLPLRLPLRLPRQNRFRIPASDPASTPLVNSRFTLCEPAYRDDELTILLRDLSSSELSSCLHPPVPASLSPTRSQRPHPSLSASPTTSASRQHQHKRNGAHPDFDLTPYPVSAQPNQHLPSHPSAQTPASKISPPSSKQLPLSPSSPLVARKRKRVPSQTSPAKRLKDAIPKHAVLHGHPSNLSPSISPPPTITSKSRPSSQPHRSSRPNNRDESVQIATSIILDLFISATSHQDTVTPVKFSPPSRRRIVAPSPKRKSSKRLPSKPDISALPLSPSAGLQDLLERCEHSCKGPFQVKAYLWQSSSMSKSANPMSIQAITRLADESDDDTFVYDGQDFDFENPNLKDKFPILETEADLWKCRKTTLGGKVRLWDLEKGDLLHHRVSPCLGSLASFLRARPMFRVFDPLFIELELNNCSSLPSPPGDLRLNSGSYQSKTVSKQPLSSRRVREAIERMLFAIRCLGITDLPQCAHHQLHLWNNSERSKDGPHNFASRACITRHLLINPNLSLCQEKETLLRLEQHRGLHLITVYLHCPARLACLWDYALKRRVDNSDIRKFKNKTVGEVLFKSPSLDLYHGQDLLEKQAISRFISERSRSGSIPWRYMLVFCGLKVQRHVYDKGWVPIFVDPTCHRSSHAVFWNKTAFDVEEFSGGNGDVMVNQYIDERRRDLTTYHGQDLPEDVREQLTDWFRVLRYRPGFASPNLLRMLVRRWMIQGAEKLDYIPQVLENAKQVTRRQHEASQKQGKKRRRQEARNGGTSNDAIDNVPSSWSPSTILSILTPSAPTENAAMKPKVVTPVDDTSLASEGHLPGDVDEDIHNSRILVRREVRKGESNPCISHMSGPLSEDEEGDPLETARKRFKRLLSVIRDAGPKILLRELAKDVRQQCREELILDVESVRGLQTFVQTAERIDFPKLAMDLFDRIRLLDVCSFFTESCSQVYGPGSFFYLKKDFSKGKIFTMTHLMHIFKRTFSELSVFHAGSIMGNVAADVLSAGTELFSAFAVNYHQELEVESKMLRLGRLCEKGNSVGFRKVAGKRRTSAADSLKASWKGSLHVSGSEPEVTYMNYRDENGHSVMGKPQSVRVLGLGIDAKECERRCRQIHKCHTCRREVRETRGDSLKCSNIYFGSCSHFVCRECLERVYDMEVWEFNELRESEIWICPHCRDMCSGNSACRLGARNGLVRNKSILEVLEGGEEVEEETLRENPEEVHNSSVSVVMLWWRDDGYSDVHFHICCRTRDGSYEGGTAVVVLSRSREEEGLWVRKVYLPFGAYRIVVVVDREAFAGTTLLIPRGLYGEKCSSREEPKEKEQEKSKGLVGHEFVKAQKLKGRRRIGWELSKNDFVGGSTARTWSSQSFSKAEGGRSIKMCSRTEGYDWRRAKFHPIAQWIPAKVGGDEEEESSEKARRALFCASDLTPHGWLRREQPRPQIGMTFREMSIKWNSWMYKRMRGMLWGIVTARSEIHGIGLFTLTGYDKGDMVIEYAGDLIRTPFGDVREMEYESAGLGTYLFKLNDEEIVDATVKSNRARFTNHSCDPNMMADVITIEGRELVVLRATRRIAKYSELTFDYQLPYEDDKKLQCLCNAWNCVGVMN